MPDEASNVGFSRHGADSAPVICPVCSAAVDTAPGERYSSEQAASHFYPVQRDPERHQRLRDAIERLWHQDYVEIYRCSKCGFGFGSPHVAGDDEYYSVLHESAGYPAWRWEYGIANEHARLVTGPERRALDIGAGGGAFLNQLDSSWQRFAVESTDIMRARLESQNVKVLASVEEAAETMPGSFHLITLFQVIEHISDFRPLLTALHKLCAPQAMLVLSMPHGDELTRRFRATRYPDMPPNHINKWTESSIGVALREAGFASPACVRQPDSWSAIPYSAYLRLRSDAAMRPRSLAGLAYRVKHRATREHMLRALGGIAALKMVARLRDARRSAVFAAVSRAS